MENEDLDINNESVNEQIKMLIDYYDIDIEAVKEETKLPVKLTIDRIKKYISRGRLEVYDGDDGVMIRQRLYKPIRGKEIIEYDPISSKANSAVDIVDRSETERRKRVFLGALSNQGPDLFNMKGRDEMVSDAVYSFFSIYQVG